MGDEEDESEEIPVADGVVVVAEQQHHVERHPAAHEDDHHGDQHLVRALLAPDLELLPLAGAGPGPDLSPPQGQGHHGVAEGDDGAGHDVLQHQAGHREELTSLRLRPFFRAGVRRGVGVLLNLVVDTQRQGDRDGDDPDGHDHEHAHVNLHAGLERVDDDEVAVHGDGGGGQRGDVDTDAEGHRHDVAQRFAEDPRVEEVGHGCEWHGQQAHANVRHCQVGDEDVGDRLHGFVAHDHKDNQRVSCQPQQEDEGVEEDKQRHEPSQSHHLIDVRVAGDYQRGGRQKRGNVLHPHHVGVCTRPGAGHGDEASREDLHSKLEMKWLEVQHGGKTVCQRLHSATEVKGDPHTVCTVFARRRQMYPQIGKGGRTK